MGWANIFLKQVVWDILTSSLYEAKMGVSYFYPWISFPMKCQVVLNWSL
jgi:hypothetical protein